MAHRIRVSRAHRRNEGHAERRGEARGVDFKDDDCRVAAMKATPKGVAKFADQRTAVTDAIVAAMKATPKGVAKLNGGHVYAP